MDWRFRSKFIQPRRISVADGLGTVEDEIGAGVAIGSKGLSSKKSNLVTPRSLMVLNCASKENDESKKSL
ncbi:MAG TPA: hypothetical protein PK317_06250 [Coprothermobacter proteolyticus]|nr:hypothetical protein [Coprothermobacter proteolyticus]